MFKTRICKSIIILVAIFSIIIIGVIIQQHHKLQTVYKIQKLIDNCPEGGSITIPKGEYYIDETSNKYTNPYGSYKYAIKINKSITINAKSVTFKYNTSNKEYTLFLIENTNNVVINDLKIVGDKQPTSGLASRVGVMVLKSENCILNRIEISNSNQGIGLFKSKNCQVVRCKTYNAQGSGIISFASEHSLIKDSEVFNCTDGHISLYGGGRYNKVVNCHVYENREGKNGEQGITLESESFSTIEENRVEGFYYGIDVKNGSNNCYITKNISTNNQYNIDIRPGDSKSSSAPSNNIKIINNDFTNPRTSSPNFCLFSNIGTGHIIEGNIVGRNGERLLQPKNITKY